MPKWDLERVEMLDGYTEPTAVGMAMVRYGGAGSFVPYYRGKAPYPDPAA